MKTERNDLDLSGPPRLAGPPPGRTETYRITDRELATVLAALRYWQLAIRNEGEPPIPDHFYEYRPLDVDEINVLCETLNQQPWPVCGFCRMPLGGGPRCTHCGAL